MKKIQRNVLKAKCEAFILDIYFAANHKYEQIFVDIQHNEIASLNKISIANTWLAHTMHM